MKKVLTHTRNREDALVKMAEKIQADLQVLIDAGINIKVDGSGNSFGPRVSVVAELDTATLNFEFDYSYENTEKLNDWEVRMMYTPQAYLRVNNRGTYMQPHEMAAYASDLGMTAKIAVYIEDVVRLAEEIYETVVYAKPDSSGIEIDTDRVSLLEALDAKEQEEDLVISLKFADEDRDEWAYCSMNKTGWRLNYGRSSIYYDNTVTKVARKRIFYTREGKQYQTRISNVSAAQVIPA